MVNSVRRFDVGKLNNVTRTPQGYLRMPAYATRTGVFTYRKPDGKVVRELRMPEEVFNADSMRTLASIPVTNDHPLESLLTSVNTKQFIVGFTSDHVSQDEDKYLSTNVTITDSDAIKQIEAGKQELSCGYTCDLEEKQGMFDGEAYDVIQRNITYNHLAIVAKGRAGSQVKLRMDSDDAEMVTDRKGETVMKKIKVDGAEFEVSPELAKAFDSEKEKAAKKEEAATAFALAAKTAAEEAAKLAAAPVETPAINELVANANNKQKELDVLQAKCDALEAEKAKTPTPSVDEKLIQERVKTRILVEKIGALLIKDASKMDSMTDLEIKKAVITTESSTVNLDGKSEDYVNARFDHIVESLGEKMNSKMGQQLNQSREDAAKSGVKDTAEEARNKMIKNSQEAWKQPLSGQTN